MVGESRRNPQKGFAAAELDRRPSDPGYRAGVFVRPGSGSLGAGESSRSRVAVTFTWTRLPAHFVRIGFGVEVGAIADRAEAVVGLRFGL